MKPVYKKGVLIKPTIEMLKGNGKWENNILERGTEATEERSVTPLLQEILHRMLHKKGSDIS